MKAFGGGDWVNGWDDGTNKSTWCRLAAEGIRWLETRSTDMVTVKRINTCGVELRRKPNPMGDGKRVSGNLYQVISMV